MNKTPIISLLFITGSLLSAQDIIPDPPDPQSGYININELNGGYGLGSTEIPYSKYFYGFTTIHGYEFNIRPININSGFFAGAGGGMLFYGDGAMFPLFGDIRYTLNLKKVSPFVYGSGGLMLNFDNIEDQSMLFIDAGIGTRIRLKDKLNLSLGTGLFMQFNRNDRRDTFVNLKAGVTFKPGRKTGNVGPLVLEDK